MSSRTVGFITDAAPLVAYCALVFTISALTAPPAPEYPFEWGDKINHALAYALMFMLAVRAARVLGLRTVRARIVPALLFCAVYGGTDEIHQYFVVGRSCDILDWVADVVGAGMMSLAIPHLARMRPVAALIGTEPERLDRPTPST